MKFLYPIKKLNIKPWIKWWILKRLNGGESSLKAVTLSSGTLTKVDKSKALSIKEYYGNAIQNGTPTPESPVEIKTISGNITFTIYEPYQSQSYTLSLGDIELCKIGDYQDYIYPANNTWYIHKEIAKIILNGTESWEYVNASQGSLFRVKNLITNSIDMVDTALLCNYYKGIPSRNFSTNRHNNETYIIYNSSTVQWLDILDARFNNVTDFNNSLTSDKPNLYYPIQVPIDTEITDATLLSQLNALYEFYVNSSTVTISNNSEIPLEVLLEYYGR